MNYLTFIRTGILLCVLSIILGAFGSHILKELIADKINVFKTGIHYHMFHALALIIVGLLSDKLRRNLNSVYYLFISGIIFFSGSLYLISTCKYSFLGVFTPIGGLFFIIGWALLLFKISTKNTNYEHN